MLSPVLSNILLGVATWLKSEISIRRRQLRRAGATRGPCRSTARVSSALHGYGDSSFNAALFQK